MFQRSGVGLGSAGAAAYRHPTAKSHQAGKSSHRLQELSSPVVLGWGTEPQTEGVRDRSLQDKSQLCLSVKGIECFL